jgi:hypothetical protein
MANLAQKQPRASQMRSKNILNLDKINFGSSQIAGGAPNSHPISQATSKVSGNPSLA